MIFKFQIIFHSVKNNATGGTRTGDLQLRSSTLRLRYQCRIEFIYFYTNYVFILSISPSTWNSWEIYTEVLDIGECRFKWLIETWMEVGWGTRFLEATFIFFLSFFFLSISLDMSYLWEMDLIPCPVLMVPPMSWSDNLGAIGLKPCQPSVSLVPRI